MKTPGTVVVTLALALAACGNAGGAKLAAACAAHVELFRGIEAIVGAFEGEGPPGEGGPPPEGGGPRPERGNPSPEVVRRVRGVYDEKLAPALAKLGANAPDEIEEDVERVRRAFAQFRSVPNFEKFPPEDDRQIAAHLFPKCPGSKAAIDLADHAFRDLPTELEAGVTRFEVENVGEEVHDLALVSRQPGVTENLEQILRRPPHEADAKTNIELVGFVAPGATSYALVDVAAGDYVAVCFIPQGTTDRQDGKGPAHFTLGMRQDVKVL